MPISATGSKKLRITMRMQREHARGFTLIEILVVVVLIAVASAMILPSYFQASGRSLDEEARRLHQALRLAAEESVLTGHTIRWSAWPEQYAFFQASSTEGWSEMTDEVFHRWSLSIPVRILQLTHPSGAEVQSAGIRDTTISKEPAPMGSVVFTADGMFEPRMVKMGVDGQVRLIEVRPWPGGVRLRPKDTP